MLIWIVLTFPYKHHKKPYQKDLIMQKLVGATLVVAFSSAVRIGAEKLGYSMLLPTTVDDQYQTIVKPDEHEFILQDRDDILSRNYNGACEPNYVTGEHDCECFMMYNEKFKDLNFDQEDCQGHDHDGEHHDDEHHHDEHHHDEHHDDEHLDEHHDEEHHDDEHVDEHILDASMPELTPLSTDLNLHVEGLNTHMGELDLHNHSDMHTTTTGEL